MSFEQIGVYDVTIRLATPVLTDNGSIAEAPTDTQFKLLIGPPQTAALERVCERLTDTIVGNWPAEDRLIAARALSSVNDPAVIPFMKQILASTEDVDAIIVEGLLRVRGDGGRAVLMEMAQSSKRERSALGANALQRSKVGRRQ